MSFGLQYWPPKPGDRRPKLTPYRLVCCAACFVMKQVVGDADRGDNCPDTARALHQGQDDQGDRPGPECVAEYGPEGTEVGRDLIRVRACCPTAAEAGTMGSRTRRIAGRERGQIRSRATDIDPDLRGAPRARLRRRLRRQAPVRQAMEQGARGIHGCGLRPAELCAGRSLSVRPEP